MFKKIVSHFTLVCFINSSCLVPVMAAQQLLLDKNADGQFVLKVDDFTDYINADLNQLDLELIDRSSRKPVGSLKAKNAGVHLQGLDNYGFYLSGFSKISSLLNSFEVKSGASLVIDSLLESHYSVKLESKGPLKLMNGFKVQEKNGFASFKGAGLTLLGESYANAILLDDLEHLVLNKDARLKSEYLETKGTLKSLVITNNGELDAKRTTLDATKLTNNKTGCINLGQAIINIDNSFNLGKIDVSKTLKGTGAWHNTKTGSVTVGQLFQGNFTKYQDDGTTFVHGFASITTESGRLTGTFLARYGILSFTDDLNIPKSTKFSIQDHLTLHSQANLVFEGTIYLQDQKEWPDLEKSKELTEKIRRIVPGIFISGNKNLTRKGVVTSENTSIQEFTTGKYIGDGSITRSGFFEKNNTSIAAATAILEGTICSYNDFSLLAEIANLKGSQKIDKTFIMVVGQLTQDKDDKTKVGSIIGNLGNAVLKGSIELPKEGQMALKIANTFETEKTFHHKGGKASIQADGNAKIAGHFEDTSLQLEAKNITLSKDLNLDNVHSSHMKADEKIIHESSSKYQVAGQNVEIAKEGIRVEEGALVKATDNVFKTVNIGGYIYNSGSIESINSYIADTGFHINMGNPVKCLTDMVFGTNLDYANIKAKQVIINADWVNLNFWADLSAMDVEINTSINLNGMGRIRGSDSLKVNALLGDFDLPGGIYQSNNRISNSLIYKTDYGIDISDPLNYKMGVDYKAWVNRGFTAAALLAGGGQALLCVKGLQLTWNAYGFLGAAYKIWSTDNKGDEENYWRPSRMAKRMGGYAELYVQAKQTYKGVTDIYEEMERQEKAEKDRIEKEQQDRIDTDKAAAKDAAEKQCLADEATAEAERKRLADEAAAEAEKQRLADEVEAERKRLEDEAETKRLAAEKSKGKGKDKGKGKSKNKGGKDKSKGKSHKHHVSLGDNLGVLSRSHLPNPSITGTGNNSTNPTQTNNPESSTTSGNSASPEGYAPPTDADNTPDVPPVSEQQELTPDQIEANRLQEVAVAEQKRKEDLWKSATTMATNMAINAISGTKTVNSLLYDDNGYNFIPHRNVTCAYLKDNSFNISLTRDVSTYIGADNSTGTFYRNTTTAVSDLVVGGKKDVATDNVVKAGGNVVVNNSFSSNATNTNVSADGKMQVEENAKTTGGRADFKSKGDMNFKGQSTQKDGITIVSTDGKATVDEKAVLTIHPSSEQKEGDQPKSPELKVIIDGKAGATLEGTVKGDTSTFLHASEGMAKVASDANVDTKGALHNKGQDALTKEGANLKVSNVTQHGDKTSYFGGNLTPTQEENSLVISMGIMGADGFLHGGEGGLLPGANINGTRVDHNIVEQKYTKPLLDESKNSPTGQSASTSETDTTPYDTIKNKAKEKIKPILSKHKKNPKTLSRSHTTKEETPEPKDEIQIEPQTLPAESVVETQPTPEEKPAPKFSVIIQGGAGSKGHISGDITVPHGILCNTGSGTIHKGTKGKAGGVIAVMASDEKIIKENGSELEASDIVYHSKEGTEIDGVSRAKNNVSATSDGTVTEKKDARTTAEGYVNFNAGTQFTSEEGAEASGKTVRRHGESNDFAGKTDAAESSIVTSGKGPLIIRNTIDNKAAHHVVGSGYNEDGTVLPLEESGQVTFEEGAKFEGGFASLRGKNIPHLLDLYNQTGTYSNFKITDYVKCETDQEVTFTESGSPASKGFELDTNKISVDPNIKLHADTFLELHSTVDNMTLGHGVTLSANVFLEAMSAKNIVGDFKKILLKDKDGNIIGVEYEGVEFIGGSGIEYDYEDPETGEISKRRVGLNVDAKRGKVKGTGMKFAAGSDIRVHGHKGVTNAADSQLYIDSINKKSNKWRDKTRIDYETEFFTPVISTPGKILISTDKGPLNWHAGLFHCGEGADLCISGKVNMPGLEGKRGHKTYRDTLIPLLNSKDKTVKGLATTTTFINQGDTKVRIWAVNESGKRYDIYAPGFNYYGAEGTLQLKGKNGYFDRPILNNYSKSTSTQASVDYSLLAHLKSLQSLQSAKDVLHHVNQGNWDMALQDLVKPSATVSFDRTTTERMFQTLGAGGINTKRIELDFTGDFHQRNGFSINAPGGGYVYIDGNWYQNGAKLNNSSTSTSIGIFGGVNGNGPSAGVRFSHTKTKGHNWVPSENNFGATTDFRVNRLVQNAATTDVKHGTGHINEVESTTKQDESKTTGFGASADVIQKNVSADVHHKETRQANHTSGLNIKNGNVEIGHADLTGAKITGDGAKVKEVVEHELHKEKDRGFSLGLGANKGGITTLNAGISNNGHELSASIDLQSLQTPEQKEVEPTDSRAPTLSTPKQLFNAIGTASYHNNKNGFGINGIPLVTGVNPDAWNEFGQDFKGVGGKIVDGATGVVDKVFGGFNKDVAPVATVNSMVQISNPVDAVIPFTAPDSVLPVQAQPLLPDVSPQPSSNSPQHEVIAPIVADPTTHITPIEVVNYEDTVELKDTPLNEISFASTPEQQDEIGLGNIPTSAVYPILVGTNWLFTQRGPSSELVNVPFVGNGLETLETPICFKGEIFTHRVLGTNCFVQNENQLEAVLNARKGSATSASPYVKNAWTALNDPELAVFYFNSGELPSGSLGETFMAKELKFLKVKGQGNKPLSGYYVSVATNSPELSTETIQGHEGQHHHIKKDKGSYIPGHHPENPQLSRQNQIDLIEDLGHDLRTNGYKNQVTKMPQSLYNGGKINEANTMFRNPWEYFENSFRKNVDLPEEVISVILQDAQMKLIEGKSQYTHPSYSDPKVKEALIKAEEELAAEIYTMFTEVKNPNSIEKLAPRTNAFYETLYDRSVFKFKNKWSQILDSTKPIVKFGVKAIPFIDWGLHVFFERYCFVDEDHWTLKINNDWSDSFTDGTLKMGVDTAVYVPFYGIITAFFGWPVALGVGGASIAAEFIPPVTDQQWEDIGNRLQQSIINHDPLDHLLATNEQRMLANKVVYKSILTFPHTASNWCFKKFDETFPTVRPTVSEWIHDTGVDLGNDINKIANAYLVNEGYMPLYTVKTTAELEAEKEARREQK